MYPVNVQIAEEARKRPRVKLPGQQQFGLAPVLKQPPLAVHSASSVMLQPHSIGSGGRLQTLLLISTVRVSGSSFRGSTDLGSGKFHLRLSQKFQELPESRKVIFRPLACLVGTQRGKSVSHFCSSRQWRMLTPSSVQPRWQVYVQVQESNG